MGVLPKAWGWFLAISAVILLGWHVGLLIALQGDDDIPTEFNEGMTWVQITHESGVKYVLRTSAIIGFAEPLAGDPQNKNGIMLSNGRSISTTLNLDSFKELVGDPRKVTEVKTK